MVKRTIAFYTCLILLVMSKDSLAAIPQDIRQTNVTDTGFTISWITPNNEAGYVNFGLTKSLGQRAYDKRGQNTLDETHYVEITSLTPNTSYYYEIVSGGVCDNNNGASYIIKTGPSLSYTGSDMAYGRVLMEDKKTPAEGAILYIKLKDGDGQGSAGESSLASCLVGPSGYWSLELVNLRTQSLKEMFIHSLKEDKLIIFAQGGNDGLGNLTVDTKDDSPTPDIIISTDIMPPEAITNLAAKNPMATQITLTWTAPGDDGMAGIAAAYDIRYSTSMINEANWTKATPTSNPPQPLSAGQQQEFTVTNLLPITTYYFAVKTADERYWSALSNIVAATTKAKESPILDWAGIPNYLKDGLNLAEGGTGTNFIYLVKYTNPNNEWPQKGEPKIALFKEGTPLGTFSLTYVQGSPLPGIIYTYSKVFPEPGNYSYRFYADKAIGAPTNLTAGPRVIPIEGVVKTTNLTGRQFTVSWISKKLEKGYVQYGTNSTSLNLTAYDDRGENTLDDAHHITLKGLEQNTIYYYDIVSGGVTDNNNGSHYKEQTSPYLSPPPQSDLVYGLVYQQGHLKVAPGTIVYLQLEDNDGQPQSTITISRSAKGSFIVNEQGYWHYDLVNLRTLDGQKQYPYSTTGDLLYLFAQGAADGIVNQIIDTKDDSSAPDMELSTDHIAPDAIADLSAFNPGTSTIALSWTAPGDDKNLGVAAAYDIRYATFTITEELWGLATEVKGEPTPQSAGSKEKFVLTGLVPGTTYYFGLKTRDEALNISELSNIARATTLLIPDTPPTLDWAGPPNYTSDGVWPHKGNVDVAYTFRVKYRDEEGAPPPPDQPKVLLYLSGNLIGSYTMTQIGGDYKTGAIYSYSQFFDTPGTYSYRFFVANATGEPTQLKEGPIVTFTPYKETNITGSQFTVPWNSNSLGTGYIEYGETPALGKQADDDRGAGTIDDTHHVTIRQLQPNTRYYYDIISSGARDDNNGFHYTIKTGPEIIPTGSDIIYGTVYKQGQLEYAPGAIVYIQLKLIAEGKKSAWGSTLVDKKGNWAIDLVNLRDEALSSLFKYLPAQDDVYLYADGAAEGTDTQTIKPVGAKPAPDMELSIDTTPPDKITDLQASQTTDTSTTLFWTSPGDDYNKGTASTYDIRYSTKPITGENWDMAIKTTNEPIPQQAGTVQTYIVTGLSPHTLYYFAIKTADERPNTSTLSNLTSTQTTSCQPPILKWADELGYGKDGIEPDQGTSYTIFTYKVIFVNPGGSAPAPGYPKLYIQRGGEQLFPEGQTMYKTSGSNFQASVVYETRIRLPVASDYYTYYFEAKDIHGVAAIGTPTVQQNGPIVSGPNHQPVLFWTRETGYTSDGVEPDLSNPGATFTFRVLYKDFNADPPASGYPKLHISFNGQPLPVQQTILVGGTFTTGAIYSFSIPLAQPGFYQYRFEAQDKKGAAAYGPLSTWQNGPQISANPTLAWAGAPDYESKGVYPLTGASVTTFVYRVKYQDQNNDPPNTGYPRVHIFKENQEISTSPLLMKPVKPYDSDFSSGVIYEAAINLRESGSYTYSFEAKDTHGLSATGSPTQIWPGPQVKNAPELTWSGQPDFFQDGLHPQEGGVETMFTYQVKYISIDNDPPGIDFPMLHIFLANKEISGSPFKMKELDQNDTNYQDGKTYSFATTLPGQGHYTYYFEAEDSHKLKATGPANTLMDGPDVGQTPVLEWVDKDGGITPGSGTVLTLFTYRVKYSDPGGLPPASGYPRLFLLRGSASVYYSGLGLFKESGNDFKKGVIYCLKVRLPIASNYYAYYFTAKNKEVVWAVGSPTIPHKGPLVTGTNLQPVLTYSKEPGFEFDSVEPNSGTPNTTFVYQVCYKDYNGDPPGTGSPLLHIYKEQQLIATRTMGYLKGLFTTGAIFEMSMRLADPGAYQYKITAEDNQGLLSIGPMMLMVNGPLVSHPTITTTPILEWLGKDEYRFDGLDPEIGTGGTTFTFQIQYISQLKNPPAQDYPRVHISSLAGTLSFVLAEANPADDNYADGKIYIFPTRLVNGTYSYWFEAQDKFNTPAAGHPTNPSRGPNVSDAPILSWVDQYQGLMPAQGSKGTTFLYQVSYQDVNNNPPAKGFPRAHILKGGQEILYIGSPFEMKPADINDVTYSDGKVYQHTQSRLINGTDYTYFFEAKDECGIGATGQPTSPHQGPAVDNPPVLEWTGELGYQIDGIEPEISTPKNYFVYRVKYVDEDNDPPGSGFPKLYVLKGNRNIDGSPFLMNEVYAADTFYQDGKFYEKKILLEEGSDYQYRFEAQDAYSLPALGTVATNIFTGPEVRPGPILNWTGELNYLNDGLHPDEGTISTLFMYRVSYQNSANNPPQTGFPRLHILKDTYEIPGSPLKMDEVDPKDRTFSDGKAYTYSITLPGLGDYSYWFEARDVQSIAAIGEPTELRKGPTFLGTPTLSWAGVTNYENTGIFPPTGTTFSTYIYKVKYIDPNADAPKKEYPKLFIYRGGASINDAGFTMSKEAGQNFTTGVIYTYQIRLPIASQEYTYCFEAKNFQGSLAIGSPTVLQKGPKVSGRNFNPILLWSQEPGYLLDGVEPDGGTPGTTFNYQVIYKDINGDPPAPDYPCLCLYKDGVFIGTRTMKYLAGTFTTGALYVHQETLNEPGQYRYRVDAEDANNAPAYGVPTSSIDGPKVGTRSVLRWLGNEDYESDGLHPETGSVLSTPFIYKIVYQDNENDPPDFGFPRVHILKGEEEITNSPFAMGPQDPLDLDYTNGRVYIYKHIFNQGSSDYKYFFEAKDKFGLTAYGTPTTMVMDAPDIGKAPSLAWTGEENYQTDGLSPEIGTRGNTFVYRIKYIDPSNLPPTQSFPQVIIQTKGTFTMIEDNPADRDYQDGKIYLYSSTLPVGEHSYFFKAINKEAILAAGPPTSSLEGPKVSDPPILDWVGEMGYISGGVEPGTGTPKTDFIYQVKYTDPNNDTPEPTFPKLRVLKRGVEITGSPFLLQAADPNDLIYSDGKVYQVRLNLAAGGEDYTYQFIARDKIRLEAVGTATLLKLGPAVNDFPALSWTGESEYIADGLNPQIGTPGTIFTFRITYSDPDNDPPAPGYPELLLFSASGTASLPMIPVNLQDNQYTDGKLYAYSTTLSPGSYSYSFQARDAHGLKATGPPAFCLEGLLVTDVPVLDWVKETGYSTDGIDPEAGTAITEFFYKVEYKDLEPPTQGFPKLHILKGGKEFDKSPFVMKEADLNDKNYQDGKIYFYNKFLQASGEDFSYWFEAKDSYGNMAVGSPVTSRPQTPKISDAPTLFWLGKGDYIFDGLHPEIGSPTTSFAYKIVYADLNNDPPAQGYPKVRIFKGEAEITGSPFEMNPVVPQDTDYTVGKAYQLIKLFPLTGTDYKYRFEAKDSFGVPAVGTPTTTLIDAPDVSRKPIIFWTGEPPNYLKDGLHPELGTIGTNFVFRISYQDPDNELPASGFPAVHILKGNQPISGSPFTMSEVDPKDTISSDGKIYNYSCSLPAGEYAYTFEAKDINSLPAEGEPNYPKSGPVVSDPPTIEWVDKVGYLTDGLDPGTGTSQTEFAYLIKYTDINNDSPASGFPKVHILKGDQPISGSPFTMPYFGGVEAAKGLWYRFVKAGLAAGFDYKYRFEAKDVHGLEATGAPLSLTDGPQVNNPPKLSWTQEEGYLDDGLNPQGGTGKTIFTYRIKYVDLDNHPPASGYPKVHISTKEGPIAGSPKTMDPADIKDVTYQDGKVYTLSLNLPIGSYTYYFEAKDTYQWPATGTSASSQMGPFVDNAPTLSWVDEEGYQTDGKNPDKGSASAVFVYKVSYTDGNDFPPAAGYPKLFVSKANNPLSPAGYAMVKASEGPFSQGVVYQYNLRLPFASEHYTYYFEAKNDQQIIAAGLPTKAQNGPVVEGTNFRPMLSFTGEPDYQFGVNPYVAKPGTTFNFRVKYWDNNGDPPSSGYPLLHLYKDGKAKGSFTAQYVSGEIPTGAIYSVSIPLAEIGIYQYTFEARDTQGGIAYGFPTRLINAPIINQAPTIEWVLEPGYVSDGLEPERGTAGVTIFKYKVKYKDQDNDPPAIYYPRLYILKDGEILPEFPFGIVMSNWIGTSSINGLIYEVPLIFSQASANYEYYFAAKDNYGLEATGTPTTKINAPDVVFAPASAESSNQELNTLAVYAYPNPDSGEEITIAAKTNLKGVEVAVEVEIYTLAGERIWYQRENRITDDSGTSGTAKILWSAHQRASGIYIYRVTIVYEGKILTGIGKLAIAR